jgi:hypothetical protein
MSPRGSGGGANDGGGFGRAKGGVEELATTGAVGGTLAGAEITSADCERECATRTVLTGVGRFAGTGAGLEPSLVAGEPGGEASFGLGGMCGAEPVETRGALLALSETGVADVDERAPRTTVICSGVFGVIGFGAGFGGTFGEAKFPAEVARAIPGFGGITGGERGLLSPLGSRLCADSCGGLGGSCMGTAISGCNSIKSAKMIGYFSIKKSTRALVYTES